ncbi:hypothetical protein, partial [Streptomyces sp.]|uniref:hypothetical protein n=1 Tax=Streptomyces sp. TaxID=1931 RepID=UPI002F3F1D56
MTASHDEMPPGGHRPRPDAGSPDAGGDATADRPHAPECGSTGGAEREVGDGRGSLRVALAGLLAGPEREGPSADDLADVLWVARLAGLGGPAAQDGEPRARKVPAAGDGERRPPVPPRAAPDTPVEPAPSKQPRPEPSPAAPGPVRPAEP